MNAPLNHDQVSHGSPEMLREFIAEHLWYIGRIVELGHLHLEIGDDDGLRRDVRRLVAYLRVVIETVAELPRPEEARHAREA
jgi:hypothetical protein